MLEQANEGCKVKRESIVSSAMYVQGNFEEHVENPREMLE